MENNVIVCIGPNPALDHTLVVPAFKAGVVSRAQSSLMAAGGKGLNVARAAQILGVQTISMGFLGGETGKKIAALAQAEGLDSRWSWIAGETRTCVIVADPAAGDATVVNESGPTVSSDDWENLRKQLINELSNASDICFSGSLPPGSPLEAYIDLIRLAADSKKRVWVDTSGKSLQAVLALQNIHIKVNGDEVGEILHREVSDPAAAAAAALELLQQGKQSVVITLGKQGAVLADQSGCWYSQPPLIQVADPIGSGDSFLAGLVTAFANNLPSHVALQHAVSAGAANATTVGGGDFPLHTFNPILSSTTLKEI